MNMRSEIITAYGKYLIGKPCPLHPQNIIKEGRWDIWCGSKDDFGTWCNGGPVTQAFINERRAND